MKYITYVWYRSWVLPGAATEWEIRVHTAKDIALPAPSISQVDCHLCRLTNFRDSNVLEEWTPQNINLFTQHKARKKIFINILISCKF